MRKNPRRILSPQRLPFRHPGSGHSNLANTQGQRNTSEQRVHQGLAEKTSTCMAPLSLLGTMRLRVLGS